MQGNFLASLMLVLWFPLTLVLFMRFRRLPHLAVSISIIGSGLLLPSGLSFDFSGLPPIGRESIAVIACCLALLISNRKILAARKPLQGAESLALILILGAVATALTNSDPRPIGIRMLPPLRLWDAVEITAEAVFFYGTPFYLGRALFRTPRDLQILMMVLMVAGLLYSLPILWEVRMSPGLHHLIYGYHPAAFNMAKRELFFGWRPMVLVGHGLALSMFVLTTALAAATLVRGMPRRKSSRLVLATGYLGVIVLLCNSVGTMVYAMFLVPLMTFASSRLVRRVLLIGVLLVVLYPALRASDIFPSTTLVNLAASYSQDRADSLEYRFDNEDLLLAQARERILFGWGGYGRGRIYDPMTSKDISTTDGYWIIVLGSQGLVGFLAIFGMLLWPVVGAVRMTARRAPSAELYLVFGIALIVVISAIDLLPNGAPTIRTVFAAGALAGALQGWRQRSGSRSRDDRLHRGKKSPPLPDEDEAGEVSEPGSLAAGLLDPGGKR